MIIPFAKKKQEELINLLVIDDDPALLSSLKGFGSPSGSIRITYCSNALDAVQVLENQKIHGILSDVNMLHMKYLDATLLKKCSEIPVYRFSGEFTSHLNIRLTKPFKLNEYREVLLELAGLAKIVKNAA